MNISWGLSVLFSLAGATSAFIGFYSLNLNPKSSSNRTFFALATTVSIWGLAFSVAISAENYETCLFFRRIAAIGWGTFFSFMLHFFIVFTGNELWLKKKWCYFILYIPALLTLLAFTFFPQINPEQYRLVRLDYGWTNIAYNNGWDIFYTIYYISYSLIGFLLVGLWGRKSEKVDNKKQARLILCSFLITMLIGSVTDIVGNYFTHMNIPQLAPFLMMFPLIVVFYCVKKYGMLNQKPFHDSDVLFYAQIRMRIYEYLAVALISGGVINIFSRHFFGSKQDVITLAPLSIFLFAAGVLLLVIKRLKLKGPLKDTIDTILICVLLPTIILFFYDSAGLTIWAVSFVWLLVVLIFKNRYIMISVLVTFLLTQAYMWVMKPKVNVTIDDSDYISRICLVFIGFWVATFVKKAYVSKIRENNKQIAAQKLITEISFEYVLINEESFDEKTNHMLEKLGEYFNVDHTYIALFEDENLSVNLSHYWCKNELVLGNQSCGEIPIATSGWFINQIRSNKSVSIQDMDELPESIAIELKSLSENQIQSFLAVPITGKGIVKGFLGIELIKFRGNWFETQINFLNIVTNIFADAIAKIEQERAIHRMAFYDKLTGLPNRNLFMNKLTEAIACSKQSKSLLAVVFVDLDGFKSVNDTMGHQGGDNLLIEISKELMKRVHPSDLVSRFGGDEFLLMLRANTNQEVINMMEELLSLFSKHFVVNGQDFFVTASSGVALYPDDGEDPETLIKNSDIAMYKAKEKGKNRYEICSSDMKEEVVMKMILTNSLYKAMEKEELIVHYQPQISSKSGEIVGMEALVRWEHPEFGLVTPGVFIPLAEQSGMINPFGEWVLKTACAQNKAWHDAGYPKIRMAVNISLNQFRNPELTDIVKRVLEETQLEPKYLELEITEGIAIKESDYLIDVLGGLKNLGLSISIDDFGTEYSSLSRLNILPIDRIKIDMQFIQGVTKNEKDQAITKGIIHLAKSLGLKVIAEGVERKEELDFLKKYHCDEVQGFYFYHPLPSEEAERVLAEELIQEK